MRPRRIGFLGFDGITALDLVGPMEAFAAAVIDNDQRGPCYEVVTIGARGDRFSAESGLAFRTSHTLRTAPALDTLVIPGGSGLRRSETNAVVAEWIIRHAPRIRRIVSVCTGIYGLAPTGLLDGRRVATHWRFVRDVSQRFELIVDPKALFLRDGPFYTSAGITAGIDLSLALIEEDDGAQCRSIGRARTGRVFQASWRTGTILRTPPVSDGVDGSLRRSRGVGVETSAARPVGHSAS